MQTDELIQSLTKELPPVRANAMSLALLRALMLGALGTVVIFAIFYGPRADLGSVWKSWPVLMKLTYALSVALCAWILCEKLARPGSKSDRLMLLPLIPIIMLLGIALSTSWHAPVELRHYLWLGHSALICPLNIALLSLPMFGSLIRGLRRAAPTQLRLTAAAAGLMSGAVAVLFYSFFCTETSVPFVASWYTLGMLLPAAYGAVMGERLLRWV